MHMKKTLIFGITCLIFFVCATESFADHGMNCEHSIDIGMELTARFVTLPDAPPMTAEGDGKVCYELGEKMAVLTGSSMPRLVHNSIDPPAGLEGLTVILEGMPGTTPVVSWHKFPEVKLSGVDIRARAYEQGTAMLPDDVEAIVDIIMSNLEFTTERVEVEGVSSEGLLDPEQMRVLLVGEAKLPHHSYPVYDEWLAGQPILLELVVKMKNPYDK